MNFLERFTHVDVKKSDGLSCFMILPIRLRFLLRIVVTLQNEKVPQRLDCGRLIRCGAGCEREPLLHRVTDMLAQFLENVPAEPNEDIKSRTHHRHVFLDVVDPDLDCLLEMPHSS